MEEPTQQNMWSLGCLYGESDVSNPELGGVEGGRRTGSFTSAELEQQSEDATTCKCSQRDGGKFFISQRVISAGSTQMAKKFVVKPVEAAGDPIISFRDVEQPKLYAKETR